MPPKDLPPRPNLNRPSLEQVVKREHISTSFVPSTPEVLIMERRLREDGSSMGLYEMAQGMFDYNKYSKGLPNMVCELKGGQRVDLPEYVARHQGTPLAAIEARNYIGDEGLEPDNVALISHRGPPGTLGQHGRGLTVVSATMVLMDHCSKITFSSSTKEHGGWFGVGTQRQERMGQKEPVYALDYGYIPGSQIDETVIRVEDPDELITRSLAQFPKDFLPVNPNYPNAQIAGAEGYPKVDNLLTVSAVRPRTIPPESTWKYFSPEQIESFRFSHPEGTKFTYSPKVEVLSPQLVGGGDSLKSTVFVDGLRVPTAEYTALNWSFYGFGSASHGNRIARSNDSSRAEGRPNNLIGLALRQSDNPAIFLPIFKALSQNYQVIEGSISRELLVDLDPPVAKAIEVAWGSLKQELGVAGEVFLASNSEQMARANQAGLPAVLIASDSFSECIANVCKIRSVNDELTARKAAAEALAAFNENFDATRSTPESHELRVLSDLIRASAYNKGRISFAPDRSTMIVDLNLSAYDTYNGRLNDLNPDIKDSALNYVLASATGAGCQVIVNTGELTDTYTLQATHSGQNERRSSIATNKASVESSAPRGVRFILTRGRDEPLFDRFTTQFKEDTDPLLNADGIIDLQKYHERESEKRLDRDITSKKRELEALTREAERAKQRIKATQRAIERTLGIEPEPDFEELASLFSTLVNGGSGGLGRPDRAGGYVEREGYDGTRGGSESRSIWSGAQNTLDYRESEHAVERNVSLIHGVEVAMKLSRNPDILVRSAGPLPTVLVNNISPRYSIVDLRNLKSLDIDRGLKTDTAIVYRTAIPASTIHLPTPPGYRPAGYIHKDGTRVSFSYYSEKNVWYFNNDKPIPPGLTVYFEKNPSVDRTRANQREVERQLDFDRLTPRWRKLINNIKRDTNLTDKQKTDILLQTWAYTFTYRHNFTRRDNLTSSVNVAEGNCSEASAGLMSLLREVGIPSRYIGGIALNNGRSLNTPEFSHALVQARINGEWVLLEPQLGSVDGYPEEGRKIEAVPAKYIELLKEFPPGEVTEELQAVARNKSIQRNTKAILATALTTVVGVPTAIYAALAGTSRPEQIPMAAEVAARAPNHLEMLATLISQNATTEALVVGSLLGLGTAFFGYLKGKQEGLRRGDPRRLPRSIRQAKILGTEEGREEVRKELRENLEQVTMYMKDIDQQ